MEVSGILIEENGRPIIGAAVHALDSFHTIAITDFSGQFKFQTSSKTIKVNSLGYKKTVFTAPFPDTFFIEEGMVYLIDDVTPDPNEPIYLSSQSKAAKSKPHYINTQQGKIYVHPILTNRKIFNTSFESPFFPQRIDSRKGFIPDSIIEGTITDENGEPLIAATIYIPEEDNGAVTDFDGKFSIESDSEYFIVSYIGFKTDTIYKPFPKVISLVPSGNIIECPVIVAKKFFIPHSFTEIKGEEIGLSSAVSVQELYNRIPGIYMHAGAINTNRMTIRGIGSRSPFATQKIRAFINDIPLTNGIGESNLEDINLGIVDNINIIKGPASPEYGSSLGGTILYESNRNIRQKDEIKAQFDYGSFNTFHGNINANFSKGKTVFSLNQDYINSDGYRDNNAVSRYNVSAFSSTQWTNDELTIFVNHTNLSGEIPSSLNLEDYSNDPSSAAANWEGVNGREKYNRQLIGVNHKREYLEKWSSNTSIFYNRLASNEIRPFNTAFLNSGSAGARTILRYGLNNNSFHVEAGLEYFYDDESIDLYETTEEGEIGNILSKNDEVRIINNGFALVRLPWKDFTFEAGISVNSVVYRLITESSVAQLELQKIYSPIVLPHFSINYRPEYRTQFYFNLSQGYSSPTLQSSQDPLEFYENGLKRERGLNAELGSRGGIGNGFEYDVSLYAFWVQDLVILENVGPDIFQSVNAGRTFHPGIEISAGQTFGNRKFYIGGSYQYSPHRFVEFSKNQSEVDGNFLPGNPQQKLFTEFRYSGKYFSTLLHHHFVGKTYANDENTIEVDSYHLTNIRLESKAFSLLNKSRRNNLNAGFYIQFNNIFDTKYASMVAVNPSSFGGNAPRYLYPGLPRNINFGFTLKI